MRYNTYSEYLKNKYGERVYKIPVNQNLTCPNRDGCLGTGGCIFCGEEGAAFENLPPEMCIREQIENNIEYIGKKYKANKYIIYLLLNTPLNISFTNCACKRLANTSILSSATRPSV